MKTASFDKFYDYMLDVYATTSSEDDEEYEEDDKFITCPECEEPIYKCDYPRIEIGQTGRESYICPICEEVL